MNLQQTQLKIQISSHGFFLKKKIYKQKLTKRHPTSQPQTIYSYFYTCYNLRHVRSKLATALSSEFHFGQL